MTTTRQELDIDTAPADLTLEVREVIEAYARAAEDEYAAIELHNLAARASAEYDRTHTADIGEGIGIFFPKTRADYDAATAVEASIRATRAADLAAEIRATKTAEEQQAATRLAELAYTGQVTEDAIRSVYGSGYGYYCATQVVLAALADD